ncbi:2-oxoglutarate dehydrogenase E1 component [Boothiomyces sp. JEL0838]|nr:2-oxoglutarate dehydrogenase E1 component [Boothiomyces sp. JEL0838]
MQILLFLLFWTTLGKESYSESLDIQQYKDGKVLAVWEFKTKSTLENNHYNLLSKSIGEIFKTFQVQELHLTFTRGRWMYDRWGYHPNAVPSGVDVNDKWKGLTNALAGLFCASLNFMDESYTSEPIHAFQPEMEFGMNTTLRYASLPREIVCTENLTPWAKLLPCQTKAGLSTLLNGYKLFDGNYQSMGISWKPKCAGGECFHELIQSFTTVLDPIHWSFESLFNRHIEQKCIFSKETTVTVQVPILAKFDPQPVSTLDTRASFSLNEYNPPFNLQVNWLDPETSFLNPRLANVRLHRHLGGSGQERGFIVIDIYNDDEQSKNISYLESIPWILKLYLHTFQANTKISNGTIFQTDITEMRYSPAIDRQRPTTLETLMVLPPKSKTTLTIHFDCAFIKVMEHYPDANYGFEIGTGVANVDGQRIYSDTILIRLPTPDFSMPYNSSSYLETMYAEWLKDPKSVHVSWQTYFKNVAAGSAVPFTAPPTLIPTEDVDILPPSVPIPSGEILDHMKVQLLVRAYQIRGHQLAKLDPLEINFQKESQAPELTIQHYGFTETDLDRKFYLGSGILPQFVKGTDSEMSLREIVQSLQSVYCGSIGIEYGHIPDRNACDWLRQQFEVPTKYRYTKDEKIVILDRLMWSDHFERFVSTKFPSEKRFGLEGCESLVPGMKSLIDECVNSGANSVVMGMPHRGRLNVLANVVRKPHESIFSEFSGTQDSNVEGSGDVKYHLGMNYARPTPSGKIVHLSLVANPSHLEAVNPVVQGKVRGIQYFQSDETLRNQAIPILLHGDAAFAGQGIVYETLGMTNLPSYTTGGTIHLIVNNQIGFTTDPRMSRSTPYCSDVAKTLSAPIIHVNGDDTEAVVYSCQLAAQWRAKYKTDVVIDIVCYRKHGHNEIDQPGFTQPLMYQKISQMTPVLEKYSDQLIKEGVITREEIDAMKARVWNILEEDFAKSKDYKASSAEWVSSAWTGFKSPSELRESTTPSRTTGIDKELLTYIGTASSSYPNDFTAHSNLARVLKARVKSINDGEGIDWATAEAMAFGTLLAEGNHVRLSGQDVERGTFSQRHALLHDQKNERTYVPLNNLVRAGTVASQSNFTVCNSSLSEYGILGFELGYSLVSPNQLVLWEAQFGDFANGAQIMIDQFIASGEQKWLQRSGLTMLLPHGYDGQGPEHSSARMERFLALCDEDPYNMPDRNTEDIDSASRQHQDCNIQVVYPTVPSNYFHALRRQVHRDFRKPLIVFESKALLRHPLAKSSLEEMTGNTRFQRLIPEVLHPNALESLLLHDDEGEVLKGYAGNNIEPRIPYALVKDPSAPPKTETVNIKEDGFTLLPPNQITTVIFCSGQVYYQLYRARLLNKIRNVAIVRIEQLNPFPFWECATVVDFYGESLEEIVYCQEESYNSGAWSFVEPRLHTAIQNSEWWKSGKGKVWQDKFDATRVSGGLENARSHKGDGMSVRGGRLVRYAGRDISAAPATGIKKQHKFEEKAYLSEALLGGRLVYPPAKVDQDTPIFFS